MPFAGLGRGHPQGRILGRAIEMEGRDMLHRLVFVVTLAVAFSAANAEAGTLITEDFESYARGSWPSTWVADANAVSDPTRNQIAADPTDSSNNVMMLHGQVGGCWGALAYRSFEFPDAFTLTFDVYNAAGGFPGCHQHRANIGMRNGTHWFGVTNPNRYLAQFMSSNEVVSPNDPYALTPTTVIAGYDMDRWYSYRIDYVRTGDSLSLHYWIDGVDAGEVVHQGINVGIESSFDQLEFTVGQGTAFLDNLVVRELHAVPLPAGLPLGVLGLALAFALRRRFR